MIRARQRIPGYPPRFGSSALPKACRTQRSPGSKAPSAPLPEGIGPFPASRHPLYGITLGQFGTRRDILRQVFSGISFRSTPAGFFRVRKAGALFPAVFLRGDCHFQADDLNRGSCSVAGEIVKKCSRHTGRRPHSVCRILPPQAGKGKKVEKTDPGKMAETPYMEPYAPDSHNPWESQKKKSGAGIVSVNKDRQNRLFCGKMHMGGKALFEVTFFPARVDHFPALRASSDRKIPGAETSASETVRTGIVLRAVPERKGT